MDNPTVIVNEDYKETTITIPEFFEERKDGILWRPNQLRNVNSCDFCSCSFKKSLELRTHVIQSHSNDSGKVPIPRIKKDPSSGSHPLRKRRKFPLTTLFNCNLCNYSCKQEKYMQKHKKMHERFQCPHCPFICTYEGQLKYHVFGNHKEPEKRYPCHLCEFKTNNKAQFDKHRKARCMDDISIVSPEIFVAY